MNELFEMISFNSFDAKKMASLAQQSPRSASQVDSNISKITRTNRRINAGVSFIVILLLTLLNLHSDFNGNWMSMQRIVPMLCMAGPMPTSLVLPPTSQSSDSSMVRVVNLTRQHGGDIFTAFGKCTPELYLLLLPHPIL